MSELIGPYLYMDRTLFQCDWNQPDIKFILQTQRDEPSDWPKNVTREPHSHPGRRLCSFLTLFACVSHRDVLSAVSTAVGNVLHAPAASRVSLLHFCRPLTYCHLMSGDVQRATGRVWLRSFLIYLFICSN